MCASWVNFAKSGDPNNAYLKARWEPYRSGSCGVMIFDDRCEMRYDFDRELVETRCGMKLNVLKEFTNFVQTVN